MRHPRCLVMLLCHAPFCVAFFYPCESRYAFYLACWDNVFKPKGQCALGWVTNKQHETGYIRWRLIWDQDDSDRLYIYMNSLINTLIFVFPFHPNPTAALQSGSARGFLPLQSFSWPQSLHICSGIRFYVMFLLNGVSGVHGTTWGAFAPFWGRGGQITWDYWPQTIPGSLSVVNCGCVVIYSRHMSRQKRSEKLCWV